MSLTRVTCLVQPELGINMARVRGSIPTWANHAQNVAMLMPHATYTGSSGAPPLQGLRQLVVNHPVYCRICSQ